MRLFRQTSVRMPKAHRPPHRPVPALEWAEDISGRCARLTAIGSRQLMVENHRGILSFSDRSITLDTGCGMIGITGSGLYMTNVRPNALMVHGEIRQIQLPCKGGDGNEE